MEFVQPIRDKQMIADMKQYLKKRNLRDHCLFVLGINSGLRVSDLLGLSFGEVVDEKGNIKDRISLREKKTGKTKDFPLGNGAKEAIREYVNSVVYSSNTPMFNIQRCRAWEILNDAAESVGIKENVGTHTLRKTFGYHAYKSGIDITILQKLLNHSSPAVTLAYIGITQDNLDDVYLSLNL